eukprot:CAMPEP_0172183468 /NCGR_PEP_ID=MMETSP1050-20130122/19011_1 /TAXON_ID=233186 /ORGANISM="Cryptomonas curvata, Strain CCAP979/52" /LENGTH=250 /DNA_ID=CAMNT_0012857107 /DNA_START=14 /DNA_END=764 /DNA_ORIENTATION=+
MATKVMHLPTGTSGLPESGTVITKYRQFQVVGRLKPSEQKGTRKANIFKMNVFAPNKVVAKSRFWYYMSMLNRVKKANGEVLQINEIVEKRPSTVSNYGIWMRYDSRTGHHNMYREYRDVSVNGAVSKMYQDVASRHRSRFSNVQIVRTAMIRNDMLRKSTNKDYLGNVKFPLNHRVMRPSSKAFKKPSLPGGRAPASTTRRVASRSGGRRPSRAAARDAKPAGVDPAGPACGAAGGGRDQEPLRSDSSS